MTVPLSLDELQLDGPQALFELELVLLDVQQGLRVGELAQQVVEELNVVLDL
jgi:hypothetical protein